MKYIEGSLEGLLDINDKQLEENHIIDIHQTVNGCNLFLICKDESGFYVRYYHPHCNDKYQYDVAELLEVNTYEKTIEIVGFHTLFESENETILEKLEQLGYDSLSHDKLINLGFTNSIPGLYHISITKSVMMCIDLEGNVSIGDELNLEYLVLTIDQLKSLYKSLTNKELL